MQVILYFAVSILEALFMCVFFGCPLLLRAGLATATPGSGQEAVLSGGQMQKSSFFALGS
jgi:hypothetical protein